MSGSSNTSQPAITAQDIVSASLREIERDAYAASRVRATIEVIPSTTPGDGLVAGRTYVFKVHAPANETVEWSVSVGRGSEGFEDFSSGSGHVFKFKPLSKHTAVRVTARLRFGLSQGNAFEETVSVPFPVHHAPTKPTGIFYGFSITFLLLFTAVTIFAMVFSRRTVSKYVEAFGDLQVASIPMSEF